jgi:hypothetical protein
VANLHFEQLLKNTQTRTLTTSVEAIVGSAGDDTITAPATVAATGVAQKTINSGDSIDGGAGTDTLTLTLSADAASNNSLSGLTITNVENIVYSGLNNLASGATQNATDNTAATAASAALTVATNTKVAADAARVVTAAELVAANTVAAASTTAGASSTAFVAGGAKALTDVVIATGAATAATTVEKAAGAAASAALKNAAGVALTTDLEVATRADELAALKLAVDNAAGTAVTTANTDLATKSLASTTATAVAAASKAAIAAVTLAANADATSITIDGTKTTVTGLKDTQTLTIKASSVANSASYAATATVAKIALSSATGTVTFTDAGAGAEAKGVVTANVSGSVKATAAADASAVATPGVVTLADTINTGGAIKTLNLAITSDVALTLSGMAKASTIDGSASTGGLDLTVATSALNITTGSGKDKVTFAPATTATTASSLTASLKTGAGNDTITVNHTGGGTATVDAGDGDDSVTMTSALGTATVDGGAGKDTVTVINTAFSTGGYNSLKSSLSNFEVLAFSDTAAVDAAKASQFSEFTFKKATSLTNNNFISKVADAQVINTTANDVVINAAGYVAKGSTDADGVTATATTYAGALTVSARGGSATGDGTATDVIVNASSVTLNVSVNPTSGTLANTASYVALSGDVKTAVVNVNNGVNNTGLPTSDITSTIEITTGAGVNSGAADEANGFSSVTPANTALKALGNLTSLTLAGTGVAIVNNAAGTKLATIDASGLVGKTTVLATNIASKGLEYTGGAVAETIKLGSALDTLTFATTASTYAKMDSITGFSVVVDASGAFTTTTAARSDDLTVTGATFIKATTGYSTTSLDAALTTLANRTTAGTDKVVFQTGGNTYIFVDAVNGVTVGGVTTQNGVEDGDTVIELVGLYDLDILCQLLNGVA